MQHKIFSQMSWGFTDLGLNPLTGQGKILSVKATIFYTSKMFIIITVLQLTLKIGNANRKCLEHSRHSVNSSYFKNVTIKCCLFIHLSYS